MLKQYNALMQNLGKTNMCFWTYKDPSLIAVLINLDWQ